VPIKFPSITTNLAAHGATKGKCLNAWSDKQALPEDSASISSTSVTLSKEATSLA